MPLLTRYLPDAVARPAPKHFVALHGSMAQWKRTEALHDVAFGARVQPTPHPRWHENTAAADGATSGLGDVVVTETHAPVDAGWAQLALALAAWRRLFPGLHVSGGRDGLDLLMRTPQAEGHTERYREVLDKSERVVALARGWRVAVGAHLAVQPVMTSKRLFSGCYLDK
jgi:hypothetical protein